MNRDTTPTGAAVALATGELMTTAARTVAQTMLTDPAAATAAVREAIARQLWPQVMPEAVRDVLAMAAQMACQAGATSVPEPLAEIFPGELDAAEGMLELTREWLAGTYPGAPVVGGSMPPPLAYASSVAFDRDEDDETLTSLAVLLTLAHLTIRDRADDAEMADHQAHEPTPGDE